MQWPRPACCSVQLLVSRESLGADGNHLCPFQSRSGLSRIPLSSGRGSSTAVLETEVVPVASSALAQLNPRSMRVCPVPSVRAGVGTLVLHLSLSGRPIDDPFMALAGRLAFGLPASVMICMLTASSATSNSADHFLTESKIVYHPS